MRDIYSLLKEAAREGNLPAAKWLVEQGADIHAGKERALRYAVWYSRLAVAKWLVKQGADCKVIDDNGNNLLWYSTGSASKEMIDYVAGLLDNNLPPEIITVNVKKYKLMGGVAHD